MNATNKDFSSTLNDLIETLKDGQTGFQTAAEGVQSSSLKTAFHEYSSQRGKFASELQSYVSRMGETPEKSGSVSGAIHRGWMNIKSAVTGRDDHEILSECERGEDFAVKAYRDALAKDLPADVKTVITQQSTQIQQAHDKIRGLRDGLKTATPIGV